MISNLGKLERRGLSESLCNTASSSTHECRLRRLDHEDRPRFHEMAFETRSTYFESRSLAPSLGSESAGFKSLPKS